MNSPKTCLQTDLMTRADNLLTRIRQAVRTPDRFETLSLIGGLGGLMTALGVTVAQAMLPPVIETEAALRRAVIAAGFDAALCPDGWATDHAALLGRPESEIKAWYLRTAMQASDSEVIAAVGLWVTRADDFRQIAGVALTRNQIMLCIADSRRLTTPLAERIPPGLRAAPYDA